MATLVSPNTFGPIQRADIAGMRLRPIPALAALMFSAACFVVPSGPAAAQPPAAASKAQAASAPLKPAVGGGIPWNSLNANQRHALAPLERDWSNIDAARRAKWIEIANRLPSMPADERQRMQARMTEWARLTPDERGRARLSFQEAKQLSPQERQARWEAYQALPEEDKKALASRARAKRDRAATPAPAGAPLAAVPKRTPPQAASAATAAVKPVAPTVVQATPGATTTLMTKTPSPPAHQKPGQPKIEAQPGKVDRTTLLPQRSAQNAAGSAAALPASAPASH